MDQSRNSQGVMPVAIQLRARRLLALAASLAVSRLRILTRSRNNRHDLGGPHLDLGDGDRGFETRAPFNHAAYHGSIDRRFGLAFSGAAF